MKILAVDDDPLILRLLEATLRNLGYQDVDFAQSGEQALQVLQQSASPFTTILLDIQMPGIDGIELCRQIRKIPEYHHTPIIMLTAMAEKEFVDQSFASGATDYINKPVDGTELSARLRVARMLHANTAHVAAIGHTDAAASELRLDFGFSDPVQIADVPRVVNSLAFGNYLRQLDRLGLFKIGMIGFHIRQGMDHHASNTADEFYGILTDVAEAIFENTRGSHALISYLGSGNFVAVVPRVQQIDDRELELNIALTLQDMELADLYEPGQDVRVAVGPQINGGMFGTTPNKMIEQAIEAAQGGTLGRRVKAGAFGMRRLFS